MHSHKIPEGLYLPRNLSISKIDENLLAEIARKQDSRMVSTEASGLDEIVKISFICVSHGEIVTSFEDIEREQYSEYGILTTSIPSHGKYAKISSNSGTSLSGILFRNTDVEYKIDDEPVLEFKYQDINTSRLNVSLTTSETCGGAPTYNIADDEVRIKQKSVNDIMEEIDETCPTNDIFKELGHFGDTFSTTHKKYKSHQQELKKIEQTRRTDAGRRIVRLFKKSRKLMFPMKLLDSEIDHLKKSIKSNMNGKTRLMKYEKERVTTMLNKNYSTCAEDVYTDDLETTTCDAHKLVMIVTRNTIDGCKSQKYTLLSTLFEARKTAKKLREDFSPFIGNLYSDMLVDIGTIFMDTSQLSLIDMLGLGKSIIEEINGAGTSRIVPIHVYDLSCNTFDSLPSNYTDMYSKVLNGTTLTNREISIIRIIDDYLRAKEVALGGKAKKRV